MVGVPKPTKAELEILGALWRLGPSNVRAVMDEIGRSRETTYTTVLKLLQIMDSKGLVRRDARTKAHVYEAAVSRPDTERRLVRDLMERALEGSTERLVQRALESRNVSEAELDAIRTLLDAHDQRERDKGGRHHG